jgi:hypothetical protein
MWLTLELLVTTHNHGADFYRAKLARFRSLSHLTVELFHKSCRPCGNQLPDLPERMELALPGHYRDQHPANGRNFGAWEKINSPETLRP